VFATSKAKINSLKEIKKKENYIHQKCPPGIYISWLFVKTIASGYTSPFHLAHTYVGG
jgi:hypothetical protein